MRGAAKCIARLYYRTMRFGVEYRLILRAVPSAVEGACRLTTASRQTKGCILENIYVYKKCPR